MPTSLPRRSFIAQTSALALAGTAAANLVQSEAESPNETVTIGVMGLSRGKTLAQNFARTPNVRVKYLCDVDSNRAGAAAESLAEATEQKAEVISDYRRILDDPEIDALVCAAPNHWHGPATIYACKAGKHVYVEKPACHNPREGELMIAAARTHNRCVQIGTQRRSGDAMQAGIAKLHDGVIGRIMYARAWYANLRGPIGTGEPADVPAHINYDLWQGPVPRRPYTSNRLHYNWHWFWYYGNGELGNNGIHALDVARWGLQGEYATRVTSAGGRYRFDDDQETPDTHVATMEFGNEKQVMWEGLSCNKHGINRSGFGVTFHGEGGAMHVDGGGYTVYDDRDREVEKQSGSTGDMAHIANFVAAIRADDPMSLNAEVEIGHKSTLLCHLGNIAYRTGRTLNCDPSNGHIKDDPDAMKLWAREYEPGWEPTV